MRKILSNSSVYFPFYHILFPVNGMNALATRIKIDGGRPSPRSGHTAAPGLTASGCRRRGASTTPWSPRREDFVVENGESDGRRSMFAGQPPAGTIGRGAAGQRNEERRAKAYAPGAGGGRRCFFWVRNSRAGAGAAGGEYACGDRSTEFAPDQDQDPSRLPLSFAPRGAARSSGTTV